MEAHRWDYAGENSGCSMETEPRAEIQQLKLPPNSEDFLQLDDIIKADLYAF